jgi:hypothetical protein
MFITYILDPLPEIRLDGNSPTYARNPSYEQTEIINNKLFDERILDLEEDSGELCMYMYMYINIYMYIDMYICIFICLNFNK